MGRKRIDDNLDKKFMSPEDLKNVTIDLSEIEKLSLHKTNAEIMTNLIKVKMELAETNNRLLKYSLINEIKRVEEIKNKINNKKEQHKNLLKSIAEKHMIEGGFGFNPETGELILNQ